jgi:hypothetical protein
MRDSVDRAVRFLTWRWRRLTHHLVFLYAAIAIGGSLGAIVGVRRGDWTLVASELCIAFPGFVLFFHPVFTWKWKTKQEISSEADRLDALSGPTPQPPWMAS